MNEKQKKLMHVLLKRTDEWITSDELASFFSVTTRTIRNIVAKINEEVPFLIESSNAGYTICKESYETYIKNVEMSNKSNQSRDSLILLELLKSSKEGLDIYNLSDKLYISESTLKNDIQRIKQTLLSDKLSISIRDNVVRLNGDEKFKRQYMVTLLYDESNIYKELSDTIQKMIHHISLDELRKTIRDVLDCHSVTVNDYALDNIVLHFAISIERIGQGYVLSENKQNLSVAIDLKRELAITDEIVTSLSEKYPLQFLEVERIQLSLQFVGLQNKSMSYSNQKNVERYVDTAIINTLETVLSQAEKIYLIDFSDEEFFNKLAVHLQSLYYRSKFKIYTRNSSIMDIKINYPIIYDVSVYLASQIQEKLDIRFTEDEIAFIALHVGSLLEKQRTSKKDIQLLLFVNDYHTLSEQMKQTIEKALDSSVVISSIKTLAELNYRPYDLLVTTNRDVATQFDDSIFVNPFLTERDINVLRKRVEVRVRVRKKESYHQLIERYFTSELFFNKLDTTNMGISDITSRMVEELIVQGYVDDNFHESIIKRETMSPTSFPSHIAVPHSIELDAMKSGISIRTLQEPIKWADYYITMVAMVAINREDSQRFNKLFEIFTEVVSESYNIKRLTDAENFEEFIMRLKLMIDDLI